jgi:hypothetical protein
MTVKNQKLTATKDGSLVENRNEINQVMYPHLKSYIDISGIFSCLEIWKHVKSSIMVHLGFLRNMMQILPNVLRLAQRKKCS